MNNASALASSSTSPELGAVSSTSAVYYPTVGTTASAGNVFLDAASVPANQLLRSTSSIRYKTDVEDMEQARADAMLQLRAVQYRSLAEADDPTLQWFGLIAEEVAPVEPRLVSFTPEGAPDGVQYSRLSVLLLKLVQQQQAEIDALEQEIVALESSR